jgi:hypothetical protein
MLDGGVVDIYWKPKTLTWVAEQNYIQVLRSGDDFNSQRIWGQIDLRFGEHWMEYRWTALQSDYKNFI